MPFTPCHMVAALPLRRPLGRLASPSALAIGSMIPDLPYYLPIGVHPSSTHSLVGVCTWDLAFGAAAFVAFHRLLRPGLVPVLPVAVRARLPRDAAAFGWPAVSALGVLVSLLLGAATHVAWDSFTHRRAVATWGEAFGASIVQIGGVDLPLYGLLQHLSTSLGLLILMGWFVRWWRRTEPVEDAGEGSSPAVAVGSALGLLGLPTIVGAWSGWQAADGRTAHPLMEFLAVGAFRGGAVLLLILPIIAAVTLLRNGSSLDRPAEGRR